MASPSRAFLILAIVAVLLAGAFAAESAAKGGSSKCRKNCPSSLKKKCFRCSCELDLETPYYTCTKCKDPRKSKDSECTECDDARGYGTLDLERCRAWRNGLTRSQKRRAPKCPLKNKCVKCSQYDLVAEEGKCVSHSTEDMGRWAARRLFSTDEDIWA